RKSDGRNFGTRSALRIAVIAASWSAGSARRPCDGSRSPYVTRESTPLVPFWVSWTTSLVIGVRRDTTHVWVGACLLIHQRSVSVAFVQHVLTVLDAGPVGRVLERFDALRVALNWRHDDAYLVDVVTFETRANLACRRQDVDLDAALGILGRHDL